MAGNAKLVDIACHIRRNEPGENAIAIADGTMETHVRRPREKWFWLPKSQIEINDDDTVTMPEWLALEKGLI